VVLALIIIRKQLVVIRGASGVLDDGFKGVVLHMDISVNREEFGYRKLLYEYGSKGDHIYQLA
jgi:hypothetical protein